MRQIKIWNGVSFDCRTGRVRVYVYERKRVCVTDSFIRLIWLVYIQSGIRVIAHLECVWQMHLFSGPLPKIDVSVFFYTESVCDRCIYMCDITRVYVWEVMSHIYAIHGESCLAYARVKESCHTYTQVWQMWRSHGICVTCLRVKEFQSMCDMTRDSSKSCKRKRVNECIVSCVREKESDVWTHQHL